ncbi:MAG: pantothenate kinase [Cyanobacteriota bacterium]|nr:pantothenate kinase [Cyanobacteriota bacterium]
MFPPTFRNNRWIALIVGNSRLHWGEFAGDMLRRAWDTPHRDRSWEKGETATGEGLDGTTPLWIASVVPEQLQFWQTYPQIKIIDLSCIPLTGVYPTLGIDRALAVWGAYHRWGGPVLVVDGGTALTFTGIDDRPELVGGAILPGLGSQFKSLARNTANLPQLAANERRSLPPRWALDTPSAIQSGVLYSTVAGVKDFIEAWWRDFPGSRAILTGGDCQILANALMFQFPDIARTTIVDEHLIFWGMQSIVWENSP